MTFDEFTRSAGSEAGPPNNLSLPLAAMWWEKKGDWHKAHEEAQKAGDSGDTNGDWVHAYLHRKEGDEGNASYWYKRSKREQPSTSLTEEWSAIVRSLLGG